MKKIILVFVAVAISAGAYAQTDSTSRKMSPRDLNNNLNQNVRNNTVDKTCPDGVVMQNGKMMKVKDGQTTTLDQEMTMSNGTKIMRDGSCINSDGTTTMMKEGQHMDMSGNMSRMNTTDNMHRMDTNRENNMDFNRDFENNPDNEFQSDGVVMQDGKMMMVKNGKRTTLDHAMTMSNGTKIMCDGNYTKEDGTKMLMKEGQHMDMAGNVIATKTNMDKNFELVPDSTRKKDY